MKKPLKTSSKSAVKKTSTASSAKAKSAAPAKKLSKPTSAKPAKPVKTVTAKAAPKGKPVVKKAAPKAAPQPVAKVAKTASKATSKPVAKPVVKAKPVAKPVVKAKPAAKVVSKAPAKAVAKAAAKVKAVAKPVQKAAPKAAPKVVPKAAPKPAPKAAPKSTPKAASKPVSKQVAKPVVKPASKPAVKPQPAVKTAAKPAPQAVAKPAAKAVKSAKAEKVTAAPAPAPTVPSVASGDVPARAVRPSARLAQITVPSMAQSVASTAAKASYIQNMPSQVLTPPPFVAVKKDPKLANNWKTKKPDQLSDAEVMAMSDNDYMNDAQMAFFRLKLVALKQGILANAGETTEHLREDTVVVPDPADRATIEEEHALELRTRDRERKLLKKIEQSIQRIDAGDYGYCDETGEPIGVGRLLARPTANLSLEAQQRRELKQKMFGD